MTFYKIEGAGNDFVVLITPNAPSETQIRQICDRHFGVGADGLICAHSTRPEAPTQKEQAWTWTFWNNDASSAAMCGNAARAMGSFFREIFPTETDFRWSGKPGTIQARYLGPNLVETSWPVSEKVESLPASLGEWIEQQAPKGVIKAAYKIDSGVPHVVLLSEKNWDIPLRQLLGPQVRHHPALGAAGANVTFVALEGGETVSFERGVEAETLACGSGALAAGMACREAQSARTDFIFPGGILSVRREVTGLWLRGPARVVFQGEFKVPTEWRGLS